MLMLQNYLALQVRWNNNHKRVDIETVKCKRGTENVHVNQANEKRELKSINKYLYLKTKKNGLPLSLLIFIFRFPVFLG